MDKKKESQQYENPAFERDDSDTANGKNTLHNPARRSSSMADIATAAMDTLQRKTTSTSDLSEVISMQPMASGKLSSSVDMAAAAAAASRRKSSIADIALALTGSSSASTLSSASNGKSLAAAVKATDIFTQFRSSQKYAHPYGNSASVMEQLLFGEEDDNTKFDNSSPMKLLVWIVFAAFMIGVAGAIILGAETNLDQDTADVVGNVSQTVTSGPG